MQDESEQQDLQDALDELVGQVEGMQVLLDFLLETLAMNVSGAGRKRLHDELRGLAEYFGDESEAIPFRRALRAIAQPRPHLRLVKPEHGDE